MKAFFSRSLLLVGLLFSLSNLYADDATLPHYSSDKHLGVGSCSNSTCHGSIQAWKKSNILQNEYITWTKEDNHSRKAYKVLTNKLSKRIARNLGLKEPAHEAKVCLDCHADNVPTDVRGERFDIADGVGCEACHGGSERWIESHTSSETTHEENLKNGLYPTEDPVARATLCYSCHFGDNNKLVTHRIMGAGHPRLRFELDTFTATQPAHYVIDKDYRKRKPVFSGVQIWAIGQAIGMRSNLDLLMDPKRGRDGIFPELVLFDCHACHKSMDSASWRARAGTGLPPGVVRFNDANFIMLRHIVKVVDAGLGKQLRTQTRALHRSVINGNAAVKRAAVAVRATTEKAIKKIAKHEFSDSDVVAILNSIVSEGLKGELRDYASAEQTMMAANNVVVVLDNAKVINDTQLNALNKALDKMFDTTKNDKVYRPGKFSSALKSLKSAIPNI